ncbi:MAG: uroporphyrinogen decarboxylase family protein [Planctomycetota bacterium]
MTSRERLLASMHHEEPDRIPIFKPNMINTREPYDDGLLAFLDEFEFEFDRYAFLGGIVDHPNAKRELPGDRFEDGYGCRFEYKGVGMPYCTFSPLARAETVADVEAFDWPDPDAVTIADDARDRAREAREGGEHLTVVGVPTLFHRYHYLRGFERWMLDVRLCPDVHDAIARHIHHVNTALLFRLLDEVGEQADMVSTGDDFGWSAAPYMSPADFRRLVVPFYRDLVGRVKERFPHVAFYLHSHGQITDYVADLADCGVDVLNPILPLDGMDPAWLKREHGARLCFHGGIDVERILPFGSVDDVREHCRRVIDILAPGGGYWFKVQAISPVMPPENVIAAYEVAAEHGTYGRG